MTDTKNHPTLWRVGWLIFGFVPVVGVGLLNQVKSIESVPGIERDEVCNPVTHVFTMLELNGNTYPTQNFLNNGNIKRLGRGCKPSPAFVIKTA